jgi:hypothetical protein
MVNRIENRAMTFMLLLIESIASQFYDNFTNVIINAIAQLIRAQRLLFDILTMCVTKISREECRYILLIATTFAFAAYYQSRRIMEGMS